MEGGSYDVIRQRLLEQAAELAAKAEALNARRKKVFGGAELALIANERIRTEHNCIARDLVSVAGHMLFGFQVFMGLKTETGVSDVFAFYKFEKKNERRVGPLAGAVRGRRRVPHRRGLRQGAPRHLQVLLEGRAPPPPEADRHAAPRRRADRRDGPRREGLPLGDRLGRPPHVHGRARRRGDPASEAARLHVDAHAPRRPGRAARTRTSTSSTPSSSRRSTATSRSRSRTTPRTARASTASPSTTRTRRSTTPTCRGRRSVS